MNARGVPPAVPPDVPPDDDSERERLEIRDAVVTFLPAILVAFVLDRVFVSALEWTTRRALLTSIGIGMALALMIQQLLKHRRPG